MFTSTPAHLPYPPFDFQDHVDFCCFLPVHRHNVSCGQCKVNYMYTTRLVVKLVPKLVNWQPLSFLPLKLGVEVGLVTREQDS